MQQIINRKRYDTKTATLLASNYFSDGSNRLPGGHGTALYRTPKGAYFFHHETLWAGSHDTIEPCSEDEAIQFHETARNQETDYELAFPDVDVEDA